MMKTIIAATVAVAACAGASFAQNYSLNPTFGSTNLSAGFAPDPYTVSITAGGNIDAGSALGGSCRGMIANAPDYRLNYLSLIHI